ncbi:MAG: hypothetical protein K6G47_13915 [Clostridia bacterium]|nr:hypothetical protein [Clostridia bacterium]
MESLKKGDENLFISLTSEEFRNTEDYKVFFDGTSLRDALFGDSDIDYDSLSSEAQTKIDASIARMVNCMLSDYEITDIKIQGNTAICTVKINLKDYGNTFSSTLLKAEMEVAQADYMAENYTRLQNSYLTLGEDATLKIIYNEFVPIFMDILADEVESGTLGITEQHTIQLKIERKENACIITQGSFE